MSMSSPDATVEATHPGDRFTPRAKSLALALVAAAALVAVFESSVIIPALHTIQLELETSVCAGPSTAESRPLRLTRIRIRVQGTRGQPLGSAVQHLKRHRSSLLVSTSSARRAKDQRE
jgi:hypothetical protein